MRRNRLLQAAAVSLALAAGAGAQAQTYSNAVQALNPAAYWPLQETTQPPALPMSIVANNSGTLGNLANGYYGAWYQANGSSWYITNNIVPTNGITGDGSKALWCQSYFADNTHQANYPGQYVVVPRTTNGVPNPAVTITAPFSIECWAYVNSTNSANRTLVSQGQVPVMIGGPDASNPYNGGTSQAWAGFALGQYQDYFYLNVMVTNGINNTGKGGELDSSGYNKWAGAKVGQWYHVVATFDGTTESIYTNGVLATSKAAPKNAAGLTYVPDPTTPLMIGNGNDFSASSGMNPYSGALDEVAIYNQALSASQVAAHYAANATNGYVQTVQADSPTIYYRFDDAITNSNSGYAAGTFPTANSYGSAGTSANGLYQPGTTPGVAGPNFVGFGANSHAVALNGFFGTVNVGNGNLPSSLNPTGTAPLTVVSWFKAGPADAPARFQNILGHGDTGYRLGLGQTAAENHFNPGPGPELQFASAADVATNGFALNDGRWHMVAGVSDGTHAYMYLDGRLAKSATNTSGINLAVYTNDLVIGGAPDYTYASGATANTIKNFDGSLAHVAFWTNALSAAQIQQLYGAAGVSPTISVQPVSGTYNAGINYTNTVVVNGSTPFHYQWYFSASGTAYSALSTQTSASLVFNPLQMANQGYYYLVVTNVGGSVTSSVAQVSIINTPVITQQTPTSIKIYAGQRPTLYVTAAGPTPTYQWTLNGSAISGATGTSYTLPPVSANGTYGCNVANSFGTTPISPISLTVMTDPSAPYPAAVVADNPVSYYRLSETSGTAAYDYSGGLNATYTNATPGQPGYTSGFNPQTDPSDDSPLFSGTTDSFAGFVPNYLNFATSGNGAFSVEAWVFAAVVQSTDAGVVTLGYGNGGEQFDLDCGGNPNNLSINPHNLRFIVRNAAGAASVVSSTVSPSDMLWHHVVGVCDQANGKVLLYVDGQLNASGTIAAGTGIKAWSAPLSIGARQSASGTGYDSAFNGQVDEVALYNTALSAAQVANHYLAAGIAPRITQDLPGSVTLNEGQSVTISATVLGTAPLTYQWTGTDRNGNPVNSTSNTLVLNNVTAAMNGQGYYFTVSNPWGSVMSGVATLTVNSGSPYLAVDLQPTYDSVRQGAAYSYSVQAAGSAPLTYTWYKNGSVISGANSSTYSFAAPAGSNTFYVHVSNSYGSVDSSTAILYGQPVPQLNPAHYNNKMKIQFAGYSNTNSLVNFPALIKLGTNLAGFSYGDFSLPNGGDLRFADSSGTGMLPHEIDQWNYSNGVSYVWVSVPQLSSTNDFIWAYWGNANPETALNPTNLWSPSQTAVYHLKEASAPILDSTLQFPSTNSTVPTLDAGLIGNGATFTGPLQVNPGALTLSNALTVSAWVNVSPTANSIQTVWASGAGGFATAGFRFYVNNWSTANGALVLEVANGTAGSQVNSAGGAVSFGTWHLVTAAIDHDGGHSTLYVDGVPVASGGSRNDFPLNTDIALGELANNDLAFPFNGTMDEARIAGVTNSAARVWADYMTVAQNSTLQSYGAIASSISKVRVTTALSGGNLILNWSPAVSANLQSAPTINGPWTSGSVVTPPYTVTPSSAAQYFRIKP